MRLQEDYLTIFFFSVSLIKLVRIYLGGRIITGTFIWSLLVHIEYDDRLQWRIGSH